MGCAELRPLEIDLVGLWLDMRGRVEEEAISVSIQGLEAECHERMGCVVHGWSVFSSGLRVGKALGASPPQQPPSPGRVVAMAKHATGAGSPAEEPAAKG